MLTYPYPNHAAMLVRHLAVIGTLFIATQGSAHEGHQPLPTQGVDVDLVQGTIALSAKARDALGVEATEVSSERVRSAVSGYAETSVPWNARAVVSTQLAGRVVQLAVQPGQRVHAGQVLARIASRDLDNLRFDYQAAMAAVHSAEAQLQLARPAALAGSIPKRRVIDLESEREQAQLAVDLAVTQAGLLGTAEQLLSDRSGELTYPVTALIDGVIIHADLAEGRYVEADEHLFEIAEPTTLWGRVRLLEKDFSHIQIGDDVEFHFPSSSEVVVGTIDYLDPHVDSGTQTVWAWAVLQNVPLLAGMSGQARVYVSDSSEAISIPRDAIFSDGMQSYVLVEEASTKESAEYRKQVVRLGDRQSHGKARWEVIAGNIYPGDRIVTQGGHELSSLLFRETLRLSESQREMLGVEMEPATIRNIHDVIHAEGVVALPPGTLATVTSQLTANVRTLNAVPGKEVAKDDVVLELFGAEFQNLQLGLLQTAVNVELLRKRVSRMEASGSDAIAIRALLEEQRALSLEEVSLQRQMSHLGTLGLSSSEIDELIRTRQVRDRLSVRSPISGRIARLNCTLGQTILPNQPLLEIHRTDGAWIEAKILAADFDRVSIGTNAVIQLAASKFPWRAQVVRMSPEIDEPTRSRTLWLQVDPGVASTEKGSDPLEASRFQRLGNLAGEGLTPSRADWFREGMMVSVQLPTDSYQPRLAIPASAVVRDGLHWFAFVKRADDDIFERRRIMVGASDSYFTEMVQGIEENEIVVTRGASTLQSAFATLR